MLGTPGRLEARRVQPGLSVFWTKFPGDRVKSLLRCIDCAESSLSRPESLPRSCETIEISECPDDHAAAWLVITELVTGKEQMQGSVAY